MRELRLNTGLEHIVIKNEYGQEIGSFDFSPTDTGILDRFERVADHLADFKLDEAEDIVDSVGKADEKIREEFDYLFNYTVSDQIFAKCNPLTLLPGGDLYFQHVLESIADLMQEFAEARAEEKKRKVKEATAKYHK